MEESEQEFRRRFDEATAQAMHDAGIIDLLMVLKLHGDDAVFNKVKDDIARDIEVIRSREWYKALSGASVNYVNELRAELKATLEKFQPFIKTRVDNIRNGTLGGQQKGERGYTAFTAIVRKYNIDPADYSSGFKLKTALEDKGKLEQPPYTIDTKSAAKYKKRYLSEQKGK